MVFGTVALSFITGLYMSILYSILTGITRAQRKIPGMEVKWSLSSVSPQILPWILVYVWGTLEMNCISGLFITLGQIAGTSRDNVYIDLPLEGPRCQQKRIDLPLEVPGTRYQGTESIIFLAPDFGSDFGGFLGP